jgi:hypothetical protein
MADVRPTYTRQRSIASLDQSPNFLLNRVTCGGQNSSNRPSLAAYIKQVPDSHETGGRTDGNGSKGPRPEPRAGGAHAWPASSGEACADATSVFRPSPRLRPLCITGVHDGRRLCTPTRRQTAAAAMSHVADHGAAPTALSRGQHTPCCLAIMVTWICAKHAEQITTVHART